MGSEVECHQFHVAGRGSEVERHQLHVAGRVSEVELTSVSCSRKGV